MAGFVGGNPVKIYSGVVVSTSAGYTMVRISDDLDIEGDVLEVTARGTAAAGALVTVFVGPGGSAYLQLRGT